VGRTGSPRTEPNVTEHILRLNAVKQRCGLSRTAIYAAIQRGEFRLPVQLTARSVGWRESAIGAWIAARMHKPNALAVRA
jgi:prophage regulatory protein